MRSTNTAVTPPSAATQIPAFAKVGHDYFGNVAPALSRLFGIPNLKFDTALTALPAFAQSKPFEPVVGQPGKDVVWVPTPQALVEKMLDMAKLTKQDFHMDLGAGDSRTVITAAKRGARSMGVEYNPDMVSLAQKNAAAAGVTDRATFAWVCDVFVDPAHRGRGLSKALVAAIRAHPDLQGLRRMHLATRDAHELYRQFGFGPLTGVDRWMQIRVANPYA